MTAEETTPFRGAALANFEGLPRLAGGPRGGITAGGYGQARALQVSAPPPHNGKKELLRAFCVLVCSATGASGAGPWTPQVAAAEVDHYQYGFFLKLPLMWVLLITLALGMFVGFRLRGLWDWARQPRGRECAMRHLRLRDALFGKYEEHVWVTKSGECFHEFDCSTIRDKDMAAVPRKQAVNLRLRQCAHCFA